MIEAYISTLPPAPTENEQSIEESEEMKKSKEERERREKALRERERRVQEEKKRQAWEREGARGLLREEEREVERALKVGKRGLKGQLEGQGNDEQQEGNEKIEQGR